jgi:LysM repeat protein
MRMIYKIIARICLTWIFLLTVPVVNSQVAVERSKDKVIISGTPYYIHLVKKGETAYSISKAYGVTVSELTKENPPAVYGVNEGQALRIPVREVKDVATEEKPVRSRKDETRFIYHKLQPGETVYALSRLYGISENDIVIANPGIEISRLPVGAEIAVPRKEFMTERQEFAVQDSTYVFHKVIRGESLTSIAEHYGIPVRELRRENRNIRFPQVGDYLRIPVPKTSKPLAAEQIIADTAKAPSVETVVLYQRPSGYTPLRNLKGSYDVAVMLPFYLRENSHRTYIDSSRMVKGKKILKVVSRPDDWIYTDAIGFTEMYEGILLAADTLSSLGLDINIHAFDIKGDTMELMRLIKRGDLASMDLFIGPVYSSNLNIISAYAKTLGVPVVSPVQLFSNSILANNPHLFLANASLEVAQKAIARKVSEHAGDNIVFIHADSSGYDQDVKNFKDMIFAELTSRLPYEEIKFKEFLFFSRSAFDNDSINRLGHALSGTTNNVIVIASEDAPVISETLMDIHTLSKKFNVTVYGYPLLRGMDNLDPRFLFELGLLIYSPYWIDYSRKDVIQFNSDYRKKFFTEPSELSYAWLGYDITYYFLSGLAVHGSEFIQHPEIHNPDLLQTEFDFIRRTPEDGFENQKLFPVRFTKEYEIKLSANEAPLP